MIMIKLGRYLRNNKGQSLVEFAIVLPVLLLILTGIMEFGIVLNQFLVVTEASREGARAAALGASDASTITTAKTAASSINSGQLQVTVAPSIRVRGNSVTVTVSNPVTIVSPMVSVFFPSNPYTVTGTAIMRIE